MTDATFLLAVLDVSTSNHDLPSVFHSEFANSVPEVRHISSMNTHAYLYVNIHIVHRVLHPWVGSLRKYTGSGSC